MSNTINTGTDIINLTANTTYNFKLYPINTNGQENSNYTTVSFTTLPSITQKYVYSVDSSSITIKWDGLFNTTEVHYSIDNSVYNLYNTYSSSTKTSTIPNLYANQRYYFKLKPINSSSAYGTDTYIQDQSATTLGNIVSLSASASSSTSILLQYKGIYSSAIVYYGTSLITIESNSATISSSSSSINTTNTTTINTNLSANTTYYISIKPYNSYGLIGRSTQTNTVTYGSITSFALGTYTYSSIGLTYNGSYSSVRVYYGTSTGVDTYSTDLTGTSGTITSNISSEQKYYLRIYPINSLGVLGSVYATELSVTTPVGPIRTYTYTGGPNPGNNNANFVYYYNYFNYSNGASAYTAGTLTVASNVFTLSQVYPSGVPSSVMIIWDFRFIPDITGTWFFEGNVDDQLLFYLYTSTIQGNESSATRIFEANDAAGSLGFSATDSGTYAVTAGVTYYARLVYVNTGGGSGMTFKYGRPASSGGTASSASSTDFSSYIKGL
jgi:hypothetical protein